MFDTDGYMWLLFIFCNLYAGILSLSLKNVKNFMEFCELTD